MQILQCKRCQLDYVRQSPGKGAISRILSKMNMVSFRCQLCAHRFWVMRRGKDRSVTSYEDNREYQRFAVCFPMTFKGEHISGQCMVRTLSIRGCSIETETRMQHGAEVSLALLIPGLPQPIHVEAAVIRAALGNRFGLEFRNIDSIEAERLRRHIETLIVTGPDELRKMYLNH
jgi:hypothetical protein